VAAVLFAMKEVVITQIEKKKPPASVVFFFGYAPERLRNHARSE
jgi:hypothetical protein